MKKKQAPGSKTHPQNNKSSKKTAETPLPDENEDKIKLKPFLGIRPGIYLTVIYSLVLLLAVFLFLFLPGLRNTGSVLIVKTFPQGAAIRVNDVYMGVSGSRIFLPDGKYLIEAVMPGFEKQGASHEIKGRVFASLFFPRREYMELSLKTSDPAAALAVYANDFASWSFGGEPTATWQIPMSLSEGAYRTGSYAGSAKNELYEILKAASRFTVTRAALRDLLRAKILLDNYGSAPSAVSLLGSLSDITVFLSENPYGAQWLLNLLPSGSPAAAAIESSAWYRSSSFSPVVTQNSGSANYLEFAGMSFINIQGASITANGNISSSDPGYKNIQDFYISQTPVSVSLFETFLNENPRWNGHYTAYFPLEIDVNPIAAYKGDAVTGITWFAADAFCVWLSNSLPSNLADMEIRLPTEDEWSAAALSVNSMRSPGWEWCADYYAPLSFINVNPRAVNAVGSPERSLRGRQSLTSTDTRASLPPDMSSPLVTFRPVIAARQ